MYLVGHWLVGFHPDATQTIDSASLAPYVWESLLTIEVAKIQRGICISHAARFLIELDRLENATLRASSLQSRHCRFDETPPPGSVWLSLLLAATAGLERLFGLPLLACRQYGPPDEVRAICHCLHLYTIV